MAPRPQARHLLTTGAMRLLSAAWLIMQDDSYVLQRRQDLPEEAFVSPKSAAEMFDKMYGVVVISYGWLSRKHPDPTGFHIRTVRMYLEKHQDMFMYDDCGVFWDFASLPQAHPNDAEKSTGLEKGLGAFLALYGDSETVVIQLTRMPGDLKHPDSNLTPYKMRGWCFAETIVASVLKPPMRLLDLGASAKVLNDEDAGWEQVQAASMAERLPPLTPPDMAVELGHRKFTQDGDLELVAEAYEEFFEEVTRNLDSLLFYNASAGPGWGNAEVGQLARALPAFTFCQVLQLGGHRALNESGLALLRMQLPHLKTLKIIALPDHLRETAEGQAFQRKWEDAGKEPKRLYWFQ